MSIQLSGCHRDDVVIRDAWILEAPPVVSAVAGYLTIDNRFNRPLILKGAISEGFGRIEMHRTVFDQDNGLTRMIRQQEIEISANKKFLFEPGGYHLMLLQPTSRLTSGDRVLLQFLFQDGPQLSAEFEVRRQSFSI